MTAALTTVCPSVCLSQSTLRSWGFGVEDQFPKIKLPRGLLARPGGGIHTKGLPVEPPNVFIVFKCLDRGLSEQSLSRPRECFGFHLRINGSSEVENDSEM